MTLLYEEIKSAIKFGTPVPEIPQYVSSNLKYSFFEWQQKAFEYFLLNENRTKIENKPKHLMFNLATGTGKTLLMAAAILYYYKKGYKHFLFFVNQNNIIDKTENNFLNSTHTKYLFKDRIVIDDREVLIKSVESFSDNPQSIEIKFTSIQKLYNDIHLERENRTALDDLHKKDIIMLADEAHHLNTHTNRKEQQPLFEVEEVEAIKGNTATETIERLGWEHTVIELILHKNGNSKRNNNVLLEFTATVPDSQVIAEKYADKIIYKFDLKEFLRAGYTKEINLIASSLSIKDRVLQALVFQWYRHKVALKYGIPNFKPVILFRSKTIADSKRDYDNFLNWVDSISSSDFEFLNTISSSMRKEESLFEQGKSRTERVLEFIKKENISINEIAEWIKVNFQEKKVIITNSASNTKKTEATEEEVEQLLNSLEDKYNHIRAIFTVQRLTEGWDVLNLYDIVRLYEGRDTAKDLKGGGRKAGSSTIAERQLIGRGVRYYPFRYADHLPNKRKFDKELDNELRVLEELFFYCENEHRYINELKDELRKEGYIIDNKQYKKFSLKDEFKESDFYKKSMLWVNEQLENPNRKKKTLDFIKKELNFRYEIHSLEYFEQKVDLDKNREIERVNIHEQNDYTQIVKIRDIDKHIFLKAVNIKSQPDNSLLRFENIKKELQIESIDELYTKILSDFEINLVTNRSIKFDVISNSIKLDMVCKFLEKLLNEFEQTIAPTIGGDFYPKKLKKYFNEPKLKAIESNNESDELSKDLANQKWYVLDSFHGTSEEISLVRFIQEVMGNLEEKYTDIYLLRNEEVYKIYDFEKGRGFQPDFLLFLKEKSKNNLMYQIFIEPKGNQYIGDDGTFRSGKEGWKEKFLDEITEKYGFDKAIKAENPEYRLIGLPFYNNEFGLQFYDNEERDSLDDKCDFKNEFGKIVEFSIQKKGIDFSKS